jgi:apolipoprotein D and lipocalin family protein
MRLRWYSMVVVWLLSACTGMPEKVQPVGGFELNRYLGHWYEIARLDHSFERGLTQVSATYSIREDGGVKVLNRGFASEKQEWKEAEGKAYFVRDSQTGYLKVSFFGPFYGSYIVMALDQENYQYSLVSGPDHSYLWILSRTPTLDSAVMKRLLDKAEAAGFDTGKLIYASTQAKE